MTAGLLAFAFLAAGVLAIFPFALYPLTLPLFPDRPIRRRACAPPSATLVFCAYNEEASIPAKLDNLRQIRAIWPQMQFRCFVDKSSDRTRDLVSACPDLLTVHDAGPRVGKATGMARMVAACDSDVVIFTDANVLVEPRCIPRLLSYFSDPAVGGVCGTLRYTNPDASDAARTSSAYWRLEERIKALETRSGSTMGADGSIFATRRELYPLVPPQLLDDFLVSMAVLFRGFRLVSAPDVWAYETAAAASADEFRRRRRIACRAYLSHRFIRRQVLALPPADIYKYVAHKLVRWYSFWFAAVAVLLGAVALVARFGEGAALVLAGAGGAVLYAARAGRSRIARAGREVFAQFLASGLGMLDAWRGRTYQTWTPQARSTVILPSERVPT